MQRRFGSGRAEHRPATSASRFRRVAVCDSASAEMLQGCPVVTAAGQLIGEVRELMIDAQTLQLCYVLIAGKRKRCAEIAIPWKTLYFDSAMARLVFYTWQ
jgi:hypothetical protein